MPSPSPETSTLVTFTSVRFHNFKAFRDFSVSLQHVNILVGPNNCGKSTILAAFRVLAAGLQRAGTRQPELIGTTTGPRSGYRVPVSSIPVSMENVHTNYEDIETSVVFRLSNGRELTLMWPPGETDCLLFASRPTTKPSAFKRLFPVSIGVIPTLGPVDHEEKLLAQDTVRRGLLGVRASAYFRNHWYHYPDDFDDFRELLTSTWPGMDVERPTLAQAGDVKLVMFCKEERTPRELYWAGFGFQVWCQTLTHIVRESGKTLVIVDEPEIYLHPELQRHLTSILREAGPDILTATHSSEIVSEADPQEILLVDKHKQSARRIGAAEGVQSALTSLGSLHNVALTQLSRTRRAVCTEGQDFRILRWFAGRMGYKRLSAAADITLIQLGGFLPAAQIKSFCAGMREVLSLPVTFFGVFDRDYKCDDEVADIEATLKKSFERLHKLHRKELENYLLVPAGLDRAIARAIEDNVARGGIAPSSVDPAADTLRRLSDPLKSEILAKYAGAAIDYASGSTPKATNTLTKAAVDDFESKWASLNSRIDLLPGKQLLSMFNADIQKRYKVQVTPRLIVGSLHKNEIPMDMQRLLRDLESFRQAEV